jgi:P27 family predicted phage terminase small subunit
MTTAAPRHLSTEARKLWRSVLADYELEPRHLTVLLCALEAFDRYREAQGILAYEGLTTTDRYGGRKPHPAVAIERDSRIALWRGLRELGLDLDAPATSRPPSRWKG